MSLRMCNTLCSAMRVVMLCELDDGGGDGDGGGGDGGGGDGGSGDAGGRDGKEHEKGAEAAQ